MREVQMLALSFFYYKMIDIEEARRLIVYVIQALTKEINAEEKLHKYLYEYPFPPKRTEVKIFVQNKDYSPIFPEYISIVSFRKAGLTHEDFTLRPLIYTDSYDSYLLAAVAS